jgi:hypothetical protein
MLARQRRFFSYVALVSQLLLPACTHYTTYHGQTAQGGLIGGLLSAYNFGEKIFEVVRARLSASQAPSAPAEVAALDNRKADFVNAVNAVITPDALQQIGPTLQAFFQLVDDGTLPAMASNVADVLTSLENEPGQKTLQAIVALASTRKVFQFDDVIEFVARTANYAEIEQVFQAIAGLINGQPSLVHDVTAFASRLLTEASQPPATAQSGPGLFDGFTQELLVNAPPRSQANFGAPAWTVRVDVNGNPAVLLDPQTGKVYAPFVDDGTGVAAVDANGNPVDANGSPISIPPFGPQGASGYDSDGRALAASGALLYDFFDAKMTLLSHFCQLGGEALRRNIHELAVDTGEIALGPRVTNTSVSPSFVGFDPANPVNDLAWGLLEVAKYDGVPKLLRSVAQVEATDPALSERVLVGVGKILEKLRPIALAPSQTAPTPADRALADQAIQLVDDLFAVPSGQAQSTGRVLFDVVHTLGQTARDLPGQLALMIDYKTLVLDAQGNVDPTQSVLVDRTQPATRAGSPQGENRSIVEQLLDLVTDADNCKTFLGLFGAPLSETLINLMAGQSASFVGTLIDFVSSPLVQMYLGIACPQIKDEVLGLKGLSASGALNGFLPIAKVFVDRGETPLLIDLLKTIDQAYPNAVLGYEPHISDVLKSGAVEMAFDLDDLVVGQGLADPVSGDKVIDIVADAIASLVAHPAGGVADRSGQAQPTLAHLVIVPLRRIDDAIFAASGGQSLANALGYAVTDLLIERQIDPQTGQEELVNPSITPFVGHAAKLLAQNLPAAATDRASMLAGVQANAISFLASRDFAAAVDLCETLRADPGASSIRDAVAHVLTPDPVAADDVFGSVLKIAVETLQTKYDLGPLRDIAGFAGDLLDPAGGKAAALVDGAAKVLQADQGKVVITLIRNTLNVPPASANLPAGQSPFQVLRSVYADVSAAANAGQPPSTQGQVAALASAMDSIVQFIRDPQGGLQMIFDVIRNRPVH